jgi:hypothetical protein
MVKPVFVLVVVAIANVTFASEPNSGSGGDRQTRSAQSQPLRSPDAILKSVADKDFGSVVQDVLNVAGRRERFIVELWSEETAGVHYDRGTMVLTYNPAFFQKLSRLAGTDWAVVFILAHEVAHYLLGHTARPLDMPYEKMELEANEVAGFVLGRLGASWEQTRHSLTVGYDLAPVKERISPERLLEATERGWRRSGHTGRNER